MPLYRPPAPAAFLQSEPHTAEPLVEKLCHLCHAAFAAPQLLCLLMQYQWTDLSSPSSSSWILHSRRPFLKSHRFQPFCAGSSQCLPSGLLVQCVAYPYTSDLQNSAQLARHCYCILPVLALRFGHSSAYGSHPVPYARRILPDLPPDPSLGSGQSVRRSLPYSFAALLPQCTQTDFPWTAQSLLLKSFLPCTKAPS